MSPKSFLLENTENKRHRRDSKKEKMLFHDARNGLKLLKHIFVYFPSEIFRLTLELLRPFRVKRFSFYEILIESLIV